MVRGKQLTDMATTQKINLSVLQRMDPDVVDVLVKAGHVTLYDFDTQTKTWARKQVEGALFVVQRKSAPEFQFCVLNRLSTENVVEDLQEDFSYEGTSSTAKLTKEKLRSAMQRLVKNDQFIEMLYKELMES
eukprot:jgi/Pico_ML_1/54966/g96.t1